MKVVNLSTTPIKGFQLHHPASVEITARGATGDREFFFVDQENTMISMTMAGELAAMKANYDARNSSLAILENGQVLVQAHVEEGPAQAGNFFNVWDVEGNFIDGPWNELVSDRVGKKVRLIKAAAGRNGSDVEPLSLVSSASIKALEDSAKVGAIDPRRFRMLIQIDGIGAHEEDTWDGQDLSIGSAVIRVGEAVKRCAATTRNPGTGKVDLKTLRLIGDYRGRQESKFGVGYYFGVYASCVQPGTISIGDAIVKLN